MNSLGGFIVVRNGARLDYCWQLAAESLLPHVQELVICDSDSDDGTTQEIQRWAEKEPKIKYANFPWTKPRGVSHHWFLEWLNFARKQLTTTHFIYLDADEILSDHPDCIAALNEAIKDGKPRLMDRLNFWRDARSLIPEGECCGKRVSRFGPCAYEAVSDEPRHAGERPILDEAIYDEMLKVFHLGFLREQSAFYRKANEVLHIWFNRYDPRLETAEKEGKPVWESECEWKDRLVPFDGYMPAAVQRWLAERGHWTPDFLPRLAGDPLPSSPPESIAPRIEEPGINCTTSGDYGDAIFVLAILSLIPGRHTILLREDGAGYGSCRSRGMLGYEHTYAALALSQPYIREVRRLMPGDEVHWVSEQFRARYGAAQNLVASLAATDGIPHDKPYGKQPWLKVAPMDGVRDRVIINHTNRWPGGKGADGRPYFPWAKVVEFFGSKCLFIGTPDEHAEFCRDYGTVEYMATPDLLVIAQLLAGSAQLVANQSLVMAICHGLGTPLLAEVCLTNTDNIYYRANAQYSYDGSCQLVHPVTGDVLHIPAYRQGGIGVATTPPHGWQYPGVTSSTTFMGILQNCARAGLGAANDPELIQRVKDHNAGRADCHSFFYGAQDVRKYHQVFAALRAVGYQV